MSAQPRVAGSIIAVISCVLVLLTLEGAARVLFPSGEHLNRSYASDYVVAVDPQTGRETPRPGGAYASSASRSSGEVVYDVVYTIDSEGRRETPVENLDARDRFLLFYGGSFVFGEGVSDDATLPYYAGIVAPRYRPYNYSFHGWSPAEMLARLQILPLTEEVAEPTGHLVYVFTADHIRRVAGSMRVTSWGRRKPYYELGENGSLVRNYEREEGRTWTAAVQRILAKSKLLEVLNIDLPPRATEQDLELTARVIDESRQLFLEQYPKGHFWVALYPQQGDADRVIIPYLVERGIKLLDFSGLFDPDDPAFRIAPDEAHPSPRANRVFAQAIVDGLGLE